MVASMRHIVIVNLQKQSDYVMLQFKDHINQGHSLEDLRKRVYFENSSPYEDSLNHEAC